MGVHDTDKYNDVKNILGIPEDEPIFILRAQDDLALHSVVRYKNQAASIEDPAKKRTGEWADDMDSVISDFTAFRNENPDRMKLPD